MYNDDVMKQLDRLGFEDFLWLFYGSIIIANIFGNYYEKKYLKTNNRCDGIRYNYIFEIVLILTFMIYIYLYLRNYNNYQKASINEKGIYFVRVIGSCLLVAGIVCFIYYQDYQRNKLL